jgi:polysaccharide biosynthesis transport protein
MPDYPYRENPRSWNTLPILPSAQSALPSAPLPVFDAMDGAPAKTEIGPLFKKYALLGIVFLALGGAAGFFSVAYFSPEYGSRALLEVQSASDNPLKPNAGGSESDLQVNIQTQLQLIHTSAFMRRVMERLQLETIPPPPTTNDVFTRLRRRLRTGTQDPMSIMRDGLATAAETFRARPVNNTRIIEITCESTNPELAATFLNTVANEYIEQNSQSHIQAAQQTNQWLTGQLEETKTKTLDAEQRLQEFVRSSGNLFVQDTTLADSKLRELQGQLAGIQADRIAKQSRFELVAKSAPESLPDVLDDASLRGYQTKLADLRRELAGMLTTLTPENPKVKNVRNQISDLQATVNKEVSSVIERLRNDYDAAVRREKLLSAAYTSQATAVSSQAGKAAQFYALKREVDMLQQTYNAMLLQVNQTGIASSAGASSVIRLVDPATPPPNPSRPIPAINIGLGIAGGLFACVGIAFLREKLDKTVRSPGHARNLLNVPELGVIPSLQDSHWKRPTFVTRVKKKVSGQEADRAFTVFEDSGRRIELPAWQQTPLLAESFRVTLASVMRERVGLPQPQVILVTSPGQEEGKTTICSNLAIALAETGRTVLLLDADFRRPRLHKVFGVPNGWGLADLLGEETPIKEYATEKLGVPTSVPHLLVLPNGNRSQALVKALYSARLRDLVQRLRKEFDTILIDVPPMLAVADARVISEVSDGIVLVLRSGQTTKENALHAFEQLRADGSLILGTVLNDWKPTKTDIKYHYYATSEAE